LEKVQKPLILVTNDDGYFAPGLHNLIDMVKSYGEVLVVALVPYCTESLAGATATLALGVTGSTVLFIAATTGTTITIGTFWVDTVPDANGVAVPAALKDIAITDSIIGTVATAAVTDGTIRFDVYWLPLSSDGKVVAA